MIYAALIIALVGWALTILLAFRALQLARESAQSERKDLEDRLLALTNPVALTHVEAVRDRVPGKVTYMDEDAEWEVEENATAKA